MAGSSKTESQFSQKKSRFKREAGAPRPVNELKAKPCSTTGNAPCNTSDLSQQHVQKHTTHVFDVLKQGIKDKYQDEFNREHQDRAKRTVTANNITLLNPTARKFTQVSVIGANNCGQLGYDKQSENSSDFVLSPKTLCFNIFIKHIACGAKHTHLVS